MIFPTLEESIKFLSDPRLNGRSPGTEGHKIAKAYLKDVLEKLGFSPAVQGSWWQPVISGGQEIGQNLVGMKFTSGESWILVGAHYDHLYGIPGADDNAAALSILLETSKFLDSWKGRSNLVFAFFDLEEPPYFLTPSMGSVQFVAKCPFPLDQLKCAIVLDLCGHDVPIPGSENALFVLGAEYSSGLVQAVRNSSPENNLSILMSRNDRIGDQSDHHAFRLAGKPFLFLTCGWWKHYHRPTDTFERLNLTKMEQISEFLTKLI
ncbi:MAG: M28 family peptidase, partial [Nitrospira sp.]|nr:M28 family peptidase [Nitrospira sp.]